MVLGNFPYHIHSFTNPTIILSHIHQSSCLVPPIRATYICIHKVKVNNITPTSKAAQLTFSTFSPLLPQICPRVASRGKEMLQFITLYTKPIICCPFFITKTQALSSVWKYNFHTVNTSLQNVE